MHCYGFVTEEEDNYNHQDQKKQQGTDGRQFSEPEKAQADRQV